MCSLKKGIRRLLTVIVVCLLLPVVAVIAILHDLSYAIKEPPKSKTF